MDATNTMGVTGVVLAGGLSRRMDRVDKGLALLDGKPMVRHVIERFAPQVGELIINANQHADAYGAYGYRVIADVIDGFAGPLAGLHAALSVAGFPLVATVPCDSPFLPDDLVARLSASLSTPRGGHRHRTHLRPAAPGVRAGAARHIATSHRLSARAAGASSTPGMRHWRISK